MIQELDRNLFLFLNSLNSPSFDIIMSTISARLPWVPLYLFMLWMFFRDRGRLAIVIALFAIAAITISDQVSVHAFKDVFERLRPCREPDLKDLVHTINGKCGGLYGFVSSHATNVFNLAVFTSLLLRRRWYTISILVWASVVSYSRIYVGVHYPGDILGGAILGALIGYLIWYAYDYTEKNLLIGIPWFRVPVKGSRHNLPGGQPATSPGANANR